MREAPANMPMVLRKRKYRATGAATNCFIGFQIYSLEAIKRIAMIMQAVAYGQSIFEERRLLSGTVVNAL
jgi:hypothetical protein